MWLQTLSFFDYDNTNGDKRARYFNVVNEFYEKNRIVFFSSGNLNFRINVKLPFVKHVNTIKEQLHTVALFSVPRIFTAPCAELLTQLSENVLTLFPRA